MTRAFQKNNMRKVYFDYLAEHHDSQGNSELSSGDTGGEGAGDLNNKINIASGGDRTGGGDGSGGDKKPSLISEIIKKIPKTLKGKRKIEHNSSNDFYVKPKYRVQRKDISNEIRTLTKF